MGNSKMFALMTVVVVVLMVATRVAEGQSTPSCAQKLVPCANFINATTPPASCCDPLREAVTQERDCLCNLYNTPGLLASFGINVTQAVLLAGHCNIPGDLSACKNASAPLPPPSVPGGSDSDSDSGVGRIAWTGMSSLVLFWASMMLY